jgi:hypothetical protein
MAPKCKPTTLFHTVCSTAAGKTGYIGLSERWYVNLKCGMRIWAQYSCMHITGYIQKHVFYERFKTLLRKILVYTPSLECNPCIRFDSAAFTEHSLSTTIIFESEPLLFADGSSIVI